MKDGITILVFAASIAIAVAIRWRVIKAIRAERLHHTRENKRFMARYRAEHTLSSRATEASPTDSTPAVIRRRPADAEHNPWSAASAGGAPWSHSPDGRTTGTAPFGDPASAPMRSQP